MTAAFLLALAATPAAAQVSSFGPMFNGDLPPLDGALLRDGLPMRGAPRAALRPMRPSAAVALLPSPEAFRQEEGSVEDPPALERRSPEREESPQRLRDVDFSKLRTSDFLPSGFLSGGGFEPQLSMAVSSTYNDNLFARDENAVSDFFLSLAPGAEIRSNWANHALAVDAELRDRRHARTSREDSTGFRLGAQGRLDIRRDSRLEARVRRLREHQSRADTEERGGSRPTPVDRLAAEVTGGQEFGRLELSFRGSYESFDFGNVPDPQGGVIRNDDRDRTETDFGGRAALRMSSDLAIYLEAVSGKRDFERLSSDFGLDRSSRVYEFILGSTFATRGFRHGEAYLGVRRQKFDDPLALPAAGLVSGLHLQADLTPLTSVVFDSLRSLEVTTVASEVSVFATQLDLRLAHEATRDLTMGLALHVLREEFVNVDREDLTLGLGVDAAYALNPNVHLVFDYDFTARDSTLGTEFRRNRATLGLEMHY